MAHLILPMVLPKNLREFAAALQMKEHRAVYYWETFEEAGLYPPPQDVTLPTNSSRYAEQYVNVATLWSLQFPEAQYPDAKIRLNLWGIETSAESHGPRISLWEYYFFKQNPMLWGSRIAFYNWEPSRWLYPTGNPLDPTAYPRELRGVELRNRLLQIESSPNYRTIQTLMGTNVP